MSPYGRGLFPCMSERERGKKKEGRRKKPRKKPLHHDWDLNPRTLSPEPSVLSIRPRRPALAFEIPNCIVSGNNDVSLTWITIKLTATVQVMDRFPEKPVHQILGSKMIPETSPKNLGKDKQS